MLQNRRFVARNKKKTLLRITLVLAAPVLLAALIFGCIALLKGGGTKTASLQELPFGVSASYAYTGKGFLYYQDGKLIYKDDVEKKNDYSLSVSSASSALRLSAGSGLAALYNDSSVLIAGTDTPLTFTGAVSRVLCGSSHVAVYVKGTDTADTIEIYTADGVKSDTLDFSTAALINYGIDAAGEDTLWTLTLSTSGGSPISTVTTYNLTQGVTNGLMNIQNELIEDVFFTAKSIFLCGTNHIIRYNRSGNQEAYRELIYGYAPVGFSNPASNPVFMLHSCAEDGFDNVKLYSMQEAELASSLISNVQLPAGTLSAELYGGKLAVFTQDKVYFYDSAGKLSSTLSLGTTIVSAEKLSDGKALLSTGDALYSLTIKG